MYICQECESEFITKGPNHKYCPSCLGRKGGHPKSLLKDKVSKVMSGYLYYTRPMLTPAEQRLLPDDGRVILVHRLIMAKKLGRPLSKGEVVMHIDGNKQNNDPDNLMVGNQFTNIRQHWEARQDAERWKGIAVLLLGLMNN